MEKLDMNRIIIHSFYVGITKNKTNKEVRMAEDTKPRQIMEDEPLKDHENLMTYRGETKIKWDG